ncbi:DUF4366 domain-containing protein [Clostridiaceae bacterium]|nr:DUF4366 domain-containing protein [Clostridiaceae bacterium]
MMDWNRKRNKRLTGTACLLLSLFLFAVPLLGMAAENTGSEDSAGVCVCDSLCTAEAFNQECPVCRENAESCTGQAAAEEETPQKPPCFCEKRCTKNSHNTQCPACAADMDLCIAPEVEEPPAACSCAEKCWEGFVNPECALCQTDRTQCTGKEPEKPSESEKPSEPEKPSESEKPSAEPEKCVCKEKCAAGAVNTDCPLCKNDQTKCTGQEPATPKFTISILSPDGWHTRKAKVTIRVRDVNGTGWETVEAKINSGGSWVDLTDDLAEKEKTAVEISENCTIYVTVTDKNGKTHTKNRYIEVFDREAPTVRAGIDGELLRVEASDDLSGVDQVYVCGNAFSDLNNGTLDVRLKDYADNYQQITIQATDNAGNKSSMTQMRNPYYEEPGKETGADSGSAANPTAQAPAAQNPAASPAAPGTAASGGGTAVPGGQKGNGSVSGQSEKPGGSGQTLKEDTEEKDPSAVNPTAMEEKEDNPFTPEGSATVVDNATDSQGKEFYTIMTPDENVFYLVIDKQRDSENVYFLNAVTESDLMALAQKDTQNQAAVTATEPEKPPEETEPVTEPPAQPEEPKEDEPEPPAPKSNNGILFLALVVALAAGGLGYYFKVYRPKHELDDAEDIDEFDFEGPEEPMVNEDMAQPFGEEPETRDISEEEEAEQRRLYEEDSEDIPIEGDDDLVF